MVLPTADTIPDPQAPGAVGIPIPGPQAGTAGTPIPDPRAGTAGIPVVPTGIPTGKSPQKPHRQA